jgi:hypothetical protein
MAKFLQETVKEDGLKADSVVKSDEFKEFFRKVRSVQLGKITLLTSRFDPPERLHRTPTSSVLRSCSTTISRWTTCLGRNWCPCVDT